jgi:hypothetical protein
MKQEHSTTLTELWIGISVVLFGLWLCLKYLPRHDQIIYNCSIAEISPDFPIAGKQQCRKQMIGK